MTIHSQNDRVEPIFIYIGLGYLESYTHWERANHLRVAALHGDRASS